MAKKTKKHTASYMKLKPLILSLTFTAIGYNFFASYSHFYLAWVHNIYLNDIITGNVCCYHPSNLKMPWYNPDINQLEIIKEKDLNERKYW